MRRHFILTRRLLVTLIKPHVQTVLDLVRPRLADNERLDALRDEEDDELGLRGLHISCTTSTTATSSASTTAYRDARW